MYQVTWKAASFMWALNRRRIFSRSRLLSTWTIGSSRPGTGGISGREGCWLVTLTDSYRWITEETFGILEQGSAIVCRQLFCLWQTARGLLFGLSGNCTFDNGSQSHHEAWAVHNELVWSDPLSYKVGCAQQQSVIKWKWFIHDWAGSEGTSKLHEEVVQIPMVSIPGLLQSMYL